MTININLEDLARWEAFAVQAVGLGVKSFTVIKAAMADAGADDALIAALAPKWDALVADVARAAGG